MSTKAEWAELFESVHGRKPSPQEFLDAKAADFDTSALAAQAASVEAPANEPVAEEVAPEPVATEEVTEQDDIADVAETAEDAVAEQASSESPFGAEAFSEAPVQQPTPQFDSSMFEKAPISSAQGFGTVPNPAEAGSADNPFQSYLANRCDCTFSNLCNFGVVCKSCLGLHHLDSPRSCSSSCFACF